MNEQEARMLNNYMDEAEATLAKLPEAFTNVGKLNEAKTYMKVYEEAKAQFDFLRQMIDGLTMED